MSFFQKIKINTIVDYRGNLGVIENIPGIEFNFQSFQLISESSIKMTFSKQYFKKINEILVVYSGTAKVEVYKKNQLVFDCQLKTPSEALLLVDLADSDLFFKSLTTEKLILGRIRLKK